MTKKIILLLTLIFLTSCNQNKVIKTHGISYLEKREKLIIINKTNKNDAIQYLGQPSTRGMTNNNLWIYIERTITRKSMLKLGKNYVSKNNVLVLEFDKYGVVKNKDFYDKNKMGDIKFTAAITENEIKKENFVRSFLSSVRQKMKNSKK